MSCLDMQDSDQYVLELYDFYVYMACLFALYGFIYCHILSCKHNYKGMREY